MGGIRAAKAMGLKIIAFDGDKNASGLQEADIGVHADINNSQSVVQHIIDKCPTPPLGAISMCSEAGMHTAAVIREHFHLPGPDIELSRKLTNKVAQRTCWSAANLPVPVWKACKTVEEGELAAKEIGYPLIVKPADSAGSRGVTKVLDETELQNALEAAFDNTKSGDIICESFFQGTEYTVESFSINGKHHIIATTEKLKVDSSRGTIANCIHTTELPVDRLRIINETAQQALTALGYTSGVGHTEVIFDETGKGIIVETAGRGAGFMLFEKFQKMTSGFDAVKAAINDCIGHTVELPETLESKPCVLSFFPSSEGVLREIHGFDEIEQNENLVVGLFAEIGHKTVASNVGDQARLGYILASAPTLKEAKAKIRQTQDKVHFVIHD